MIKCVAIDDEPIALTILQEYCRRYGDIELRCFTSPVKGMAPQRGEGPRGNGPRGERPRGGNR